MKSRANDWVDQFPRPFHTLASTDQIVRLVYFHTIEENRETISREELEQLFGFVDTPVPPNLPQLLAYLCGNGGRLIAKNGEYSLRREVRQAIGKELGQVPPPKIGHVPQFEFGDRQFKDEKVRVLLSEAKSCYGTGCWNACGILMRIVLERTLDASHPSLKTASGLQKKLDLAISTPSMFSKTIIGALKQLKSAKLIGDIAAHHSSIILDKSDIDLVTAPLKMLIKEVTTV